MQEPDPRTIRLAASGDVDAFTEIVRATQPHVWRFIRHLVHDDDLAADLTQDTYLRVHRSLHSFRGDSLFRSWLYRIARNVTIDEQRRRARRPERALPDEIAEPAGVGPGLRAELDVALAELPELQRSAFVLVEVFGLRYREVAGVLEIPEGTVKSRVYKARVALVRWFETDPTELEGGGEGG